MQTNNTNTQVPAELQDKIRKQASEWSSHPAGIACTSVATEWATKYWQEHQENQKLKEEVRFCRDWMKQQMELNTPILEWGQGNPNLRIGESIHAKVLLFAKLYEKLEPAHKALKEKAEKMIADVEKATRSMNCLSDAYFEITAALRAWNSEQKEGE